MLVVPGFHMGEMTRGGRVYLLVDGATCVLVDTGAPDGTLGAGQLIESARRRPHEVRLVLLTHAHPGHAGNIEGLRRLTGAPVAAGAEAAAALGSPAPGRRRLLRRGGETMPAQRVDRIVEPGERIDLGGGIEVHDAPGHGAGSLAFHLVGPDVLCLGDAARLGAAGLEAPPRRRCADPDAADRTVRHLAGVGARVLAPGHGLPTVEGLLPRRTR